MYSDGSVYSGSWAGDVRCGLGECVLPNGDSYFGQWDANDRHGQGSFVYRSKGRIYEGQWVRGVPKAGELRDFPSGGGTAGEFSAPSLGATTAMPPLKLLDPLGVVQWACLSASGRMSGSSGSGAAAQQQRGGGTADSGRLTEGSLSDLTHLSTSRPPTREDGMGVGMGGMGDEGLAFDPGLTQENLEILAAAFTSVDVRNTGFIPADPAALVFILQQLSIDPPADEDLLGLMEELVQNTNVREGPPVISFAAFVAAMGKAKE